MRDDPVRLLSRVNGLTGFERESLPDDVLLAGVKAGRWEALRRRHRWRPWLVGLVVVAVPAGAAYALWPSAAPSDPRTASCYSDASPEPRQQVDVAMSDDPVGACRHAWDDGTLAAGSRTPPADLTACIAPGGIVAVLPGAPDVCGRAGLPAWTGVLAAPERQVLELQDRLVAVFFDRCVQARDAVTVAKEVISASELEGWVVQPNNNWSAQAPCTAAFVDVVNRTVTLGGRPSLDTSHLEEP